MLTRRKILISASALALSGGLARAQAWPTRFVRLIVPYPAGGGADAIARIVGQRLSEMWGQQVLIENKGGAGGNIASDAAAKSPPDGYTMYLGAEFLTTNPHVYPKLSYDPIADLTAGHGRGAVPDHRRAAEFLAGEDREGVHRLRESQSRPHLRHAGPRHRPASRGRAVQARRRHRAHPRALSRRRARAERSHPRPHRLVLQQHRAGGAADAPGPGARPRGHHRAPLRRRARRADHRGVRPARLRRARLVRDLRAGEVAARDRRQDECRREHGARRCDA